MILIKKKLNNELKLIKEELNEKNIYIKKLDDEIYEKDELIKNLNIEIKEIKDELEYAYKNIGEKKQKINELNILNDRLIKEKQEKEEELSKYKNELNEYENELNRVSNTHSQKMIELSNELKNRKF